MVYNGARGDAAEEMSDVLALNGMSADTLNRGYADILASTSILDSDVTIEQANSIWLGAAYEALVKPVFLSTIDDSYEALVQTLDFQSAGAADTINGWVSDNTHGYITELVQPPISLNTAMFLINALYFAAPWTFEFDEQNTGVKPFTTADGNIRQLDTMQQEVTVRYHRGDNFQMVELPYGHGIYAMTILLPDDDDAMTDVLENTTVADWDKWHDYAHEATVTLSLPRFEVSFDAINGDSANFVDAFKSMGMPKIFDISDVYLSGMLNLGGDVAAQVGDVKQKTYMRVDEAGAVGAAASMVEILVYVDGGGWDSETMDVNRPFLFAIRNRCNGGVLFWSQINDPDPISAE